MVKREPEETHPPVAASDGGHALPAGDVEALLARAARQKWVIGAASLVALAAAYAGTIPFPVLAVGWALVIIAALLTPAPEPLRQPESKPSAVPLVQSARPRPTAPAGMTLISALPDPCLLVTGDGRIVDYNAAAVDLFGHIETGRPLSALLRAPEIATALRQTQQQGEPVRVDYFERVPIDRWFEAHFAPVDGGESPGTTNAEMVLVLLRDVTKQQRVERMRVDFIANASHELRTPLASLAGFIETLQGSARDDPEARTRFLDIMRAQTQRMSRLVNDLLSLSRIELNAHIRPSERVDLAAVIANVSDTLTPLAAAAGVKINVARPEGPVMVAGERDELGQVFQNLIENAIKYGAEGGRIDVNLDSAAGAGPDMVAVSVRDYGPGIAAEHLPRLTERFYRVDVASSREKGGTGLGLAIVKHILNRHRGSLQIASVPGEGATFTVRLQLAEHAASRSESAAE